MPSRRQPKILPPRRPTGRASISWPSLSPGRSPKDGITFCSYLLPQREAVWWAHQCLDGVLELLSPEDQDMLALAESWVRYPEEDQRCAVLDAGMAAPTKTPGVWVALAAGWSGGSMLPRDAVAPVEAPPYLTAKAVNAACSAHWPGSIARRGPPRSSYSSTWECSCSPGREACPHCLQCVGPDR